MSVETYLRALPKVELHIHLEGSIRPETLLKLARRHAVPLPADTVEGLRRWYTFTDFAHFVEIYIAISKCLRTPEDIELIAREFLQGQAEQNIRHSEVTYTAYTIYKLAGIPFAEQLAALNRARAWGEKELDVTLALVMDIPREISPAAGALVGQWAAEAVGQGVDAFGLGGNEVGNPPEKHLPGFEIARAAGLPSVPHAGETMGADSVRGALHALGAVRLGHGIRCLRASLLPAAQKQKLEAQFRADFVRLRAEHLQ